jgi:hypothetical protein
MLISWAAGGWTKSAFIRPLVAGSNGYFVVFMCLIFLFVISLALHLWIVIGNYIRGATIDTFYGQFIVPSEEINALKKKVNKKYMILFCISLGLLFWIGWLIYKKVKGTVQSKKGVVVAAA